MRTEEIAKFKLRSVWQLAGVFLLIFSFSYVASAVGLSKQDIITRLKDMQSRQATELRSLDDGIKKRFSESTTVNLKSVDLKLADRRISRLGGQVEDLSRRRLEFSARRDFLSTLIFTVDTKWNGQPLNTFFEHSFLDMAMTDISGARDESRLSKFLMYASIAVREAPEPREDVLNVLENYINYANVIDPKTPAMFIASRSYTNGNLSYSAKPVPRDEVGDNLDKKLKEISQQPVVDNKKPETKPETKPSAKAPADIELRLPPLAGPPPSDEQDSISATTIKVDSPNISDEQPKATPKAIATTPKAGPPVASPTPAQRSLPNTLPPINPTNGAAVPPPPPDVPGQNN